VNEHLKRLEEIRQRAAELRDGELNKESIEEIKALMAEREDLESKIEAEKALDALSAEAPKTEEPKAEEAEEPKADGDGGEGEGGEAAPAEGDEGGEAAPAEGEAEEAKPEPEAIAAALSGAKPAEAPATEGGAAPQPLAIVASSSALGMTPGSRMEVEDWANLGRRAAKAGEGETRFAVIDRKVGTAEAVSSRNSAIQNTVLMSQKHEEAQLENIAAAACYCGPFETMKDIKSIGENGRPVASIFRSVPVTGPFQYVRDVTLADVAPGVSQWTCADQTAVDPLLPATFKPCVDLDCLTPVQVDPYSVLSCGRFSIYQQVSHPELIDDFINKLGIVYDRTAEQLLLDQLRADSTVITHSVAGLGLLWELEQVLGHLKGLSSYVRRINWDDYTLIMPPGAKEALILDEHLRGFSRGANEAGIMEQLRALGVGNVVEALDADTTAEADYLAAAGIYVNPGATVAFDPATAMGTFTFYLVPTSAYTRGESVLVEAGYTRDSALIRQNMTQFFFEGHEFLEKMTPDVPSYTLEITGCANGGSSALIDPAQC
jgi:hypothetical protein